MARHKGCVAKMRRKEEGKRRNRQEKEKNGDQIAIKNGPCASLYLRSRHFLDQSEIRY